MILEVISSGTGSEVRSFSWVKVVRKIAFSFSFLGSGCGSVGRAVDCDIRGLRFESSHRHNLY